MSGTRAAIGALARVELAGGKRLIALVDGGNGHSGKRSSDLHFGLGATPADTVLKVDVHWRTPTGRVEKTTLEMTPGWHTVVLADSTESKRHD
ncbi:MAG: ASPIC/UnbV domain-containing protein [Planctomycetia bacterium]|nr:ASPIC/UnbV domain-containing protein [Planctomycetia bacterium]